LCTGDWVQRIGHRELGTKDWAPRAGYKGLGTESWVQRIRHRELSTEDWIAEKWVQIFGIPFFAFVYKAVNCDMRIG
jgi:hypothetical protein